jgi:hypothetical protein
MIGNRALLSLAQYLDSQPRDFLAVLFEKHGLKETWNQWDSITGTLQGLIEFLRALPVKALMSVLAEIVATEPVLRDHVVNEYGDGAEAYAARWGDLVRCLALDDFTVSRGRLIAAEPDLQGASHVEDALTAAISSSGLPNPQAIVGLLDQGERLSADSARLQRLSQQCAGGAPDLGDRDCTAASDESWRFVPGRQVGSGPRLSPYVEPHHEERRESRLVRLYVISPGAHQPVGFSQEEMVRLGRGMAVSICYFLVKLHNGQAAAP